MTVGGMGFIPERLLMMMMMMTQSSSGYSDIYSEITLSLLTGIFLGYSAGYSVILGDWAVIIYKCLATQARRREGGSGADFG